MKIDQFKLVRFLEKSNDSARYQLSASDCESFDVGEILSRKELLRMKSLRLAYSETQGSTLLRKEIAELSTNVGPDEIVVCAPQEGVFIAMNALLDAGDRVVVQSPCYQALSELPRAIGCKVIRWEPKTINGQWCWDVNFLRENVDKDTRLIVINSPHNPTGHLFTKEEYLEIIDIARENNCLVLSDEIYRLLEYDEEDRLPIGSGIYEKCISLSGISKTFGLGGLRIGWLSIRDKALRNRIIAFKDYTTMSNSVLSEYVATIALRKKKLIISRNLGIIKNNLGFLDSFFSRFSDKFVWFRPRAGSVSLVKIKFRKNIEDFCEDFFNKKSVLLTPGTTFDYGNQFFRLGFGRKNMLQGLKLFEEYVNENLQKKASRHLLMAS